MNIIGKRLREARDRKELKQTDVHRKTGINNKTLSGYENGVSEPDYDSLKILSDLYEVSIEWLLGSDSKKETAEATSKSNLDLAVEKIEKDLGVSITDDPEIMEALESYLRTLGKMKKK